MKQFRKTLTAVTLGMAFLASGPVMAKDGLLGGLLGGITGKNGIIGSNVSDPRANPDVQREVDYLGRDAKAESDYLGRDAKKETDYLGRDAQREVDYYNGFNR